MNVDVVTCGQNDWLDRLRAAMQAHAQTLGVGIEVNDVSLDNVTGVSDDPLVYFLGDQGQADGSEKLTLATQSRFVLPVCGSAPDASRLPKELGLINAFLLDKFGDEWPAALADLLASRLWVGRTVPKVFISYKRDDSQAVANQLFDELVRLQFDVFLDDCSIARGADFQRELKFWLNDADLVCLLVTRNLTKSKWVMEEIEFAKSSQIGFLTIIWPDIADMVQQSIANQRPGDRHTYLKEVLDRTIPIDQHHLTAADFTGAENLTERTLGKVVGRALSKRTECLFNRLNHLLPYARDEFESEEYTVSDGQRLGELLIRSEAAQKLVKVLPYRPKIAQFFDLYNETRTLERLPNAIGCFYSENDPNHEELAGLRWALERYDGPERIIRSFGG